MRMGFSVHTAILPMVIVGGDVSAVSVGRIPLACCRIVRTADAEGKRSGCAWRADTREIRV
jgi:hypothetical protein